MYAKIENGIAVEYPVYEGQLQERFPDKTYPLDTSGDSIPDGYVKVKVVAPEESFFKKQKPIRKMPELIDGEWIEVYEWVDKTPNELQETFNRTVEVVRADRDTALKLSDNAVRSDVWDKYTAQEKQEWTDYRQALRDIPQQEDFPYDVEFPLEPSTFEVKIV
jgi:hypothetical protein